MIKVIIVGEDPVTRHVIKRLISDTCPEGIEIEREDPVRGSEIKRLAPNYNRLAASFPIILLADLDNKDCPVDEQMAWLNGEPKHPNLMFRFAVDEAESWLLADREGFAHYLGIDAALIPQATPKRAREPLNVEVRPPYKSSLFLMLELAARSPKSEIKRQLTPLDNRSKSAEYNTALLPFIDEHWHVTAALENSTSLRKMINRLQEWCIGSVHA